MRSDQIRDTFFDYFTSRGHIRVPSSPLIPDDPTLLLANAGMNQFKPYFLGEVKPPYPRATSVQKCARTSDIDNVGQTTRHATFFEMLGNFSFGDYFKNDAIRFAYELLTEGYGLDRERLWVTVYLDDDEAERYWRDLGVPGERIQRLGMADNYWSMGVPGPCGPCSEVCYDRGPAFGEPGGPQVNGERYLEIWNLVFMQNLRGEGTSKDNFEILGELPRKNIDTGLGLDRLAAILQDVETVCETDLLAPTLAVVQDLAGRRYPGRDGSHESASLQIVTEHARSIAFLIADGVLPSNEGRGYVLRRLMRRAVRHARLLGITDHVLAPITHSVIGNLSPAWPELGAQSSLIDQVVQTEEEAFDRTLRHGSRLLDAAISSTGTSKTLDGQIAFELHDTYGFPIDLTIEIARDAGVDVDQDRFAALLDQQRQRAKAGSRAKTGAALRQMDAYRELSAQHGRTTFVGYDHLSTEATVIGIVQGDTIVGHAREGDTVEIILNQSPFYAESGGQVGDAGILRTANGTLLTITDTRLGLEGFHVHTATITNGEITTGTLGEALVDADRRAATARSHSATHVLHAMLRRTLGEHASQHGSLVTPGRLRFDFAHFSPVDHATLAGVQQLVNDALYTDPDVRVWHATRAEAAAAGATALFGEKYGDTVRIVDIGDFSRELCGGTHIGHGSQAGPVHILGESSIGSNLRRIEALTGPDALRHYDHQGTVLRDLTALLGAQPDQLVTALQKRLAAAAQAQKELDRLRTAELTALAARLAEHGHSSGTGWLVTARLTGRGTDDLRQLALSVLDHRGNRPTVVALAGDADDKAQMVAALSPDLAARGVHARSVLARASKAIGGGAGGQGAIANAGGRNVERLDEALQIVAEDATRILAG